MVDQILAQEENWKLERRNVRSSPVCDGSLHPFSVLGKLEPSLCPREVVELRTGASYGLGTTIQQEAKLGWAPSPCFPQSRPHLSDIWLPGIQVLRESQPLSCVWYFGPCSKQHYLKRLQRVREARKDARVRAGQFLWLPLAAWSCASGFS